MTRQPRRTTGDGGGDPHHVVTMVTSPAGYHGDGRRRSQVTSVTDPWWRGGVGRGEGADWK